MDNPKLSSLVGREREVASLMTVLDRLQAGEGVALLIQGEAGIGKTALMALAAEQVGLEGRVPRRPGAASSGNGRSDSS